MSWAVGLALAAAVAGRQPSERQALADLAYVLGEAHALKVACAGPADQTWRGRMNQLLEVEKPDEAFRRRLTDSFNLGFTARQAEHPSCDEAVPAAERSAAERGRALAERLAGDGL